jgi:hypothetical protein
MKIKRTPINQAPVKIPRGLQRPAGHQEPRPQSDSEAKR